MHKCTGMKYLTADWAGFNCESILVQIQDESPLFQIKLWQCQWCSFLHSYCYRITFQPVVDVSLLNHLCSFTGFTSPALARKTRSTFMLSLMLVVSLIWEWVMLDIICILYSKLTTISMILCKECVVIWTPVTGFVGTCSVFWLKLTFSCSGWYWL